MEPIYVSAVMVIIFFAIMDLWVGVTNDAVNFLNSAIGSRAGKKNTIMFIAAIGVLIGATFSNGMMEVARKGVFDPSFFYTNGVLDLDAILALYLGVMVASILLLDLYNTFGLPTSTTVGIVSALLGSAAAVSFWRHGSTADALAVINQGPVLAIYGGIFLSVLVAFVSGAVIMLFARVLFSFDLKNDFAKYGWIWIGISTSTMLYFVLFKGLKQASFLDTETSKMLSENILYIMIATFSLSSIIAIVLSKKSEQILKVLILGGTCSLAMAFAGNDLVNFIGPSVAAAQAVFVENVNLSGKVPTPAWALILAGAVMIVALYRSKKTKTVVETEIRIAAMNDVDQRFESSSFARMLISISRFIFRVVKSIVPSALRSIIDKRTDPTVYREMKGPPYDLLRASVNLTVASMIISIGTARKLPLSTTYVTFMVAMGASLADRAWTKDSVEGRVTGMITIIGGWLLTGLFSALGAFVMASIIYGLGLGLGIAVGGAIIGISLYKMSGAHESRFGDEKSVMDEELPIGMQPIAVTTGANGFVSAAEKKKKKKKKDKDDTKKKKKDKKDKKDKDAKDKKEKKKKKDKDAKDKKDKSKGKKKKKDKDKSGKKDDSTDAAGTADTADQPEDDSKDKS